MRCWRPIPTGERGLSLRDSGVVGSPPTDIEMAGLAFHTGRSKSHLYRAWGRDTGCRKGPLASLCPPLHPRPMYPPELLPLRTVSLEGWGFESMEGP